MAIEAQSALRGHSTKREPLNIAQVRLASPCSHRSVEVNAQDWASACSQLQTLGFHAVLLTMPLEMSARLIGGVGANGELDSVPPEDKPQASVNLPGLVADAKAHSLALMMDISLDRLPREAIRSAVLADWYPAPLDDVARDPRISIHEREIRPLRKGPLPSGLMHWWTARLRNCLQAGVTGFRFFSLNRFGGSEWHSLLTELRGTHHDAYFLGWTPGLSPAQLLDLHGVDFDGVFSSLPWWDYQAEWYGQELLRLGAVAPVYSMPHEVLHATSPTQEATARRALWTAAFCGDGVLVPDALNWPDDVVRATNLWRLAAPVAQARRICTGRDNVCTTIVRYAIATDETSVSLASTVHLLAVNPQDEVSASIDWGGLATMLPPGDFDPPRDGFDGQVPRADCTLFTFQTATAVGYALPSMRPRGQVSLSNRIAVEQVSPAVEAGGFAVKCITHDEICVQADIFMDGHDVLAAGVRWRACDEHTWQWSAMRLLENDRWEARFRPSRVGAHEFELRAWRDTWGTYLYDLNKKRAAGQPVTLEVQEGLELMTLAIAREGAGGNADTRLIKRMLSRASDVNTTQDQTARWNTAEFLDQLSSAELIRAMRALDDRQFEYISPLSYPLWVDRPAACFGSWYELFPRSLTDDVQRHGTFKDVIKRLPALRDMGFDVLYMPPIHPIGRRNRKGRNNSLTAAPDDVGSPYAIGAQEGGHETVAPQLGTLEDFLTLVSEARAHGLEVALDFAIQCSPDHPWLSQHPDWFSWRADGSLRYAENPPKKYEDIVNVSFYAGSRKQARRLALWRALRNVVLFWARQGVRLLRVDNPHTKPLPFWRWLIGEVHEQYPDLIFLSEAFTRPKMMYRLAKVGFGQSYTYFTWRNEKHELEAYLQEISASPVADFFRPHFFVNTPDINPYFLQSSGRPGFLIRLALAATGAGLWGMYSGFELCEAAAIPGKEEYLDSEKYEIRPRDWDQSGNIRAEITSLNHLRRTNPALQTHRGLTLNPSGNDRVVCFVKATPTLGNVVLVAVSLDPHADQQGELGVPLALFGEPLDGRLAVEDLLTGHCAVWSGPFRACSFSPSEPYRIWRLSRVMKTR